MVTWNTVHNILYGGGFETPFSLINCFDSKNSSFYFWWTLLTLASFFFLPILTTTQPRTSGILNCPKTFCNLSLMLKYEQGYKEPNFVSASVVRLSTSDASLLTPAYHPKLPISFCMYVCVHTNAGAHLCGYICMYMWRPEIHVGCYPPSLLTEAGSFTEPEARWFDLSI